MRRLNARIVFLQGSYLSMQCVSVIFFVQAFKRFGYSNTIIGTILMFNAVISIFTQPFWGYMADKLAKDRQIIGGCTFTGALLYGAFIFSGGAKTLAITAAVGMYAIFFPMMHLIDSYIAKLILDGYAINYSATRAGGSLSYSVTAFLFGHLIAFMGMRYTPLIGMRIAPFIYIIFCIIHLLTLWKLPDARCSGEKKQAASLREGISYLMHNPVFVAYVAAYILMSLTSTPTNQFYPVVMFEMGGNESNVGTGISLQSVCELPVMLSFTWVMRKTRIRPVVFIIIGMVFFSLKAISIAYAPGIAFVYLGSMLHGLSFAIFLPASVAFLMENVRREYLSSAQMISVAIGGNLISILGSPLTGMLVDAMGAQHMLRLMCPGALFGAAVMFLWGGVLGRRHAPILNKQSLEKGWEKKQVSDS